MFIYKPNKVTLINPMANDEWLTISLHLSAERDLGFLGKEDLPPLLSQGGFPLPSVFLLIIIIFFCVFFFTNRWKYLWGFLDFFFRCLFDLVVWVFFTCRESIFISMLLFNLGLVFDGGGSSRDKASKDANGSSKSKLSPLLLVFSHICLKLNW